MKQRYDRFFISLLLFLITHTVFGQITGVITDSLTREPLSYITVHYEGTNVGTISDENGKYRIDTYPGRNEITFSAIGYDTKVVRITPATRTLNIQLTSSDVLLDELVVKPGRERYSRRNNPAVDLMHKVIANKSAQKLEEYDYYQYDKYQKMKLSMNDVTPESLKKGMFKRFTFLVDQIELSPQTNKLILPVSVQETASQIIYRKNPKSKKTIINGVNTNGIGELFATDDMLGTVLDDVFSDINIYDNDIRLLQRRFVSPISSTSAISFYKFYIMDTLYVGRDECIHLSFVPQNPQDFGFTGHLYVLNDSSYAVKKCTMNLPVKTAVNFIDYLDITQEYEQLENGNWALVNDDMIAEMYIAKSLQGAQIHRTTKYTNYSFGKIDSRMFRFKGDVIRQNDMLSKSDEYWAEMRQVPLTKTESMMDTFVDRLFEVPGFKYFISVIKAVVENYIETGTRDNPSKFDIGPINTMVSSNYVDGLRLRLSGQTTAQLHPHLFFTGYGAYGFKDEKWKYEGTVTYAFNKKTFLPREFPKNNLSFRYTYDVQSPMDKFLFTDKDNVFVSLKTTTVDQMSYVRDTELKYERETNTDFSFTVTAKNSNDEPTGKLEYIRNNAEHTRVKDMTTTEFGVSFRYAPGETYINTKQRRRPVSLDAPVYTLSHTTGVKGLLGGDYTYNYTEASLWKRIWLSSWGKADVTFKAGAQWNTVPFPLLIMPEANLSYITQRETFNLINNMEFFNDRFASFSLTYDMNGKLFNRIPLIKKLKWRETLRFRSLWGTLTDKNNPYKNGNDDLFLFPMRDGEITSFVMDPKTPYMEVSAGIYNIFKIVHIEYVRRLNYLDNPNINKHGVRFMILMVF
ncbi:MAG: DUF5686 and carboxypeptidase regulatory-like domain-containing protein [Bacteroides sp.]|nr:DUF5686 and carboxypeptidase regulatory-like domain-containing protein [Bacteroides sp.]